MVPKSFLGLMTREIFLGYFTQFKRHFQITLEAEFQDISSGEWNSVFQNFRERGQPRGYIPKFSKIFHRDFLFHFILLPEFSEFSVRWFVFRKFQEISDFLDTFQGNFRSICLPSESSVIFGPQNGAQNFGAQNYYKLVN